MKPLIITSGEPAGIGPDICLSVPKAKLAAVILADRDILTARKQQMGLSLEMVSYQGQDSHEMDLNKLYVIHHPTKKPVTAGKANPKNSPYVLALIEEGVKLCQAGKMSALVTAPVNKAIINEAGIAFSGHTEFLAELCQVDRVVMMLACEAMRVALVTTHLPLALVPQVLTGQRLIQVIEIVNQALMEKFAISKPRLVVAGLNPHAGEQGYLGREEIDIIEPAVAKIKASGIDIQGPVPADTMFCSPEYSDVDAFISLYHDQGLPVVKYAGFKQTVNVTLGLPIIRTSVDHGTAYALAASGRASPESLLYACQYAWALAHNTHR